MMVPIDPREQAVRRAMYEAVVNMCADECDRLAIEVGGESYRKAMLANYPAGKSALAHRMLQLLAYDTPLLFPEDSAAKVEMTREEEEYMKLALKNERSEAYSKAFQDGWKAARDFYIGYTRGSLYWKLEVDRGNVKPRGM